MFMLNLIGFILGQNMIDDNIEDLTFAFSELQQKQFTIVNDGVMGGRSVSKLVVQDQAAHYTGEVSLENNGGFASVRMLWPFDNIDVDDEPTVAVLKVIGDGLRYQFRLRTNQGFDGAAYSFSFETTANQEQSIYIPIEDFVATFRGRKLTNMPKLSFSDVQQMGVLVADKQVGKFNIKLLELSLE